MQLKYKKSFGFFGIFKAAGWLPFVKFVLLFNHKVAVKLQNFNPGVFIFAEDGVGCSSVNDDSMRAEFLYHIVEFAFEKLSFAYRLDTSVHIRAG